MKARELRERNKEELLELERQFSIDLADSRFKKGAGEIKDTTTLRKLRRDLARVKTALREQDLHMENKTAKNMESNTEQVGGGE
ncbi:MAG: 50S ribosomal protein L29 [Deltaproteobacteria bacterium]|nr:50S ribosomal protein L29 [Deltaproteobacteria bacterium]